MRAVCMYILSFVRKSYGLRRCICQRGTNAATYVKTCTKCGQGKELTDYYTRVRAHGRVAYFGACKDCCRATTREAWAKNGKRYNAAARGAARALKYGITPLEWKQLLEAQGYKCAICKGDLREATPHTDHCHETDQVRGLLCSLCNPGIGFLRHDPELLEAAARYLRCRVYPTTPLPIPN